MGARSRYTRRSATQWQELIAEQTHSGMGQAAFCAAHGVALSSLQYWKRRLHDKAPVTLPVTAGERLFAPLAVPSAVPADAASKGWSVELDLGGGVCLRLWHES